MTVPSTGAGGAPAVRYDHLLAMTDSVGLFEHARGLEPAREHGYCVDDVARGLVVVLRERELDAPLARAATVYLRFVLESQSADGLIANRRSTRGVWTTPHSIGDWWGRAIWGLGAAARGFPDPDMRSSAFEAAERSMGLRAPWSRSMAFAALGAAEIIEIDRGNSAARSLLEDAAAVIGRRQQGTWPWPQPRLSYANAAVCEALIAAGSILGRDEVLTDGLDLLAWLLDLETRDGHLSVTPVGGTGPDHVRPAFDQQPIEVAAMADACARAAQATGDSTWLRGVDLAHRWMSGDNDSATTMYDSTTGAGYDGLERDGRNGNCGAESTLAALAVEQHARHLSRTRSVAR